MRFTVFQIPNPLPPGTSTSDLHYGEGTAFQVICKLLEECSLPELNELKMHTVSAAQRRVKARLKQHETEAFGRTGVMMPAVHAAESWSMDDRITLSDAVPPEETYPLTGDEDDEPDDADATPLAEPDEIVEAIRVNRE